MKIASNLRNRHIQELAGQSGVLISKNSLKTDLNLSPYTVFHAEYGSGIQIGPKPTQDLILTILEKIDLSCRTKYGHGTLKILRSLDARLGIQSCIQKSQLYIVFDRF